MDRSETERRAAQRPGDQPETEGSRDEKRVQRERDSPRGRHGKQAASNPKVRLLSGVEYGHVV